MTLLAPPPFDPTSTLGGWIVAQRIFDGHDWLGHDAFWVEQGIITAWGSASQARLSGQPVWELGEHFIVPGFFDIQVNGAAGLMFNNAPDRESLLTMGRALHRLGTTHWLPTLITDAPDRMTQAAQAIEDCLGQCGIVGVHFEGPHISVEKRGVHHEGSVRPLDDLTMTQLRRLRQHDIPVLMTLAPEQQMPGTIQRLVELGVKVSIGHTAANAVQVQQALAEGATGFTHLFNAMTAMTSREPGVVGAALDSEAWCGVIADGHHVHDMVLRVAMRSRPRQDRMIVVSDAMATIGGPDYFDLYGERIQVREGKLVNESGALAGAHIDMASSVHRLIHHVGVSPKQALRMATQYPAEFMGLSNQVGCLKEGQPLNAVVMRPDWTLVQSL